MTQDGRRWPEREKLMTIYRLLEMAVADGLCGFYPVPGTSFLVRTVVDALGEWSCIVDALEEEGVVLCTSFFPVKAAGERGPEVRRLVAELNSLCCAGVFDVYGDDCRVVFQMPVGVEELGAKGVEMVARAVRRHMLFVEFQIPLFQSVECGVSSVSEVVDGLVRRLSGRSAGNQDRLLGFFSRN